MAFTIPTHAPFRADIVGSFLRPDKLKNARNLHRQGTLDDAGLKTVEDECIADLIAQQIKHGLRVITDGEFRRSFWHQDFFWGLGGIEKVTGASGYKFAGIETRNETSGIRGKITGNNHPFVEHFKFVKTFETKGYGLQARQTVPAPAQLLSTLLNVRKTEEPCHYQDFYASVDDLIADLGAAYRQVFKDLYAAGCRSIQMDDCTWTVLCDVEKVKALELDVDKIASLYLQANNAALEGKPEDLTICTHICRGNYRSHYFSNGSYDRVSDYVLAQENVNGFYLEYDDERSGTFEALKKIPQDKKVVLGIITTKTPDLENEKTLIERVHEAAKYFPLDNLSISPQCGFASTEEGNALTEKQQWAKVDLVVSTANKIWGY